MTKPKAAKRWPALVMPKDREALIRRAGEEADGCISVAGLAYGSDRLRGAPRAAATAKTSAADRSKKSRRGARS